MTIIKNGCDECGKDYYTVTEQCDTLDCKGKRIEINENAIWCNYSDRQIVSTMFDTLNELELEKILEELKKQWKQ